MAGQSIICVLGMHRSGTSLVTRILNLLGVHLGPEEQLLPPAADNLKGFWEHQGFLELNDRILAGAGGDWYRPPAFPPDWPAAPGLEDLRASARVLIDRDFAGADTWGWKDPRTCLTLPFWQQLLPRMRYVLCFRNPSEVVRSLQRRDGLSLARSVHLWLTYVRSILGNTAGRPRCIVCYEDLLENWQRETRRLAAFLGSESLLARPDVQKAVCEFIDRDLRHHHGPRLMPENQAAAGPAEQALDLAHSVYGRVRRDGTAPPAVGTLLRDGLALLAPAIRREQEYEDLWIRNMEKADRKLLSVVGEAGPFILVDEDQLRSEIAVGPNAWPFLERDGRYWGSPENDQVAVREFERLREAGARHIAFAWPSFWWLEYYRGFHQHLRSNFPCVLEDELLVVFDLRKIS